MTAVPTEMLLKLLKTMTEGILHRAAQVNEANTERPVCNIKDDLGCARQ